MRLKNAQSLKNILRAYPSWGNAMIVSFGYVLRNDLFLVYQFTSSPNTDNYVYEHFKNI